MWVGCLSASATGSSSKALVQMQELEERTTCSLPDVEAFKGIRTSYHQLHEPPKVFLVTPRQYEFPEVETTRQVQQSADGGSGLFRIKFKGPGQRGRGQWLKADLAVVSFVHLILLYIQVLKKGQGANKFENL